MINDSTPGIERRLRDESSPTVLPSILSGPGSDAIEPCIAGLATARPDDIYDALGSERLLQRWYKTDDSLAAKLVSLVHKTGIETRALVKPDDIPELTGPEAPSIDALDTVFRRAGVNLAVAACRAALAESTLTPDQLTHTVATTCTNAGCPGYDVLVNRQLGVASTAQRTLLHGTGCAGGLSALRVAADLASAASARARPARVLVYATEVTSIFLRGEMAHAEQTGEVSLGPALFADGAAAVVVVNDVALCGLRPIFWLREWSMTTVPETGASMSYYMTPIGFHLNLPRSIPDMVAKAIRACFDTICATAGIDASPGQFDWALHPAGARIIQNVQDVLGLNQGQLQSSWDVYRTQGNTSSVSVLAVLDGLRSPLQGRREVLACSIGPGMTIEMAVLRRA